MEKYLIKRTSGITEMTRRFDKDKNFTLLNIFCKMVTEQMSRVFREAHSLLYQVRSVNYLRCRKIPE